MTEPKKKNDATANKSYVKYRAPGPNNPIAYPIGIASTPSPKDAHIMKFAVFYLDSLYPNYKGRARYKANIDAKNIPFKKEPINAANQW